jgi:hypothetical protein
MTILTLVDVLVRTLQEQATSNHVSQLKLGAFLRSQILQVLRSVLQKPRAGTQFLMGLDSGLENCKDPVTICHLCNSPHAFFVTDHLCDSDET